MRSEGGKLGLDYLGADEADGYLARHGGYLLGIVGFGQRGRAGAAAAPLWVDIPVLDGPETGFEVWTSDVPVEPCDYMDVHGVRNGAVLFGSLMLEQPPGVLLDKLAAQAYTRIFDFINQHGYRNLLRAWHYFPQINEDENGLERYRRFNIGRHKAFVANGWGVTEENIPAASAVGSTGGSLVIYFMAGKQPGKAIENPRQVSAYDYPQSFGPRSPIFVRGISAALGGQHCFFISGTASVVGYETVHPGNIEKQTSETLLNIRTLLQQLPQYHAKEGRMLLKVYLRHAHDLDTVRARVREEFGEACKAIYLQSDICRSDLLLEIEGVYFNDVVQ